MKQQRTLAEKFLWLGVTAVAVAGLYALVPVFARTPQFAALGLDQRFFDVALVVHVDLSVLFWFFSMICMGAAGLMQNRTALWPYWQSAGFYCIALAAMLVAISPLGTWEPVKSNYIPVLHNGVFLPALGLLAAGLVATLVPVVCTYMQPRHYRTLQPIELAWVAAALVSLFALVGYGLSGDPRTEHEDLLPHYEVLFWTGGHIMQFAFTLLAMAAWLNLLQALGSQLPKRIWSLLAYDITAMGAVMTLYSSQTAGYGEFFDGQTRIMIEWGAAGAALMVLMLLPRLLKTRLRRETRALAAALIVSLVLFFFGGVLGLMIQGQNVTIPAHYHGMITGITQGLMGLAYVMLPRFGYQSVAHTRLAFWQPIIYGLGQLMHIGGLAYCGGYGVLRKTAGGFEHLAPDIKVALGIFGLGGLLAITGGILFVIVMLRAKRTASAWHQA